MNSDKISTQECYINDPINKKLNESAKIDLDISLTISQNMDNILNNDSYAFDIYKQIITHSKIIRELQTYEFINFIPPKYELNSVNDCVLLTQNILHKFQYKVGGFNIEDYDWFYADNSTDCRFKLKENDVILYNSINTSNVDSEFRWFLRNIYLNIEKCLKSQSSKYTVNFNIVKDDNYKIFWIIFIFN